MLIIRYYKRSKSKPFDKVQQQGFTLIELLIASSLMLVAIGLTMNFVFGFNRTGTKTIIRSTLEERLRSSLARLEREIMDASEVSSSSNANTLIL